MMDFATAKAAFVAKDYASDQCTPEPELVAILGRLNATREQIGQIESMVGGFVDRLNGGRPVQDDACSTKPMRGGIIGELHDRLDGIGMALDRIQKDAANLNRIA